MGPDRQRDPLRHEGSSDIIPSWILFGDDKWRGAAEGLQDKLEKCLLLQSCFTDGQWNHLYGAMCVMYEVHRHDVTMYGILQPQFSSIEWVCWL